jgi:drug/metabolite transporter (DMT)-like permease
MSSSTPAPRAALWAAFGVIYFVWGSTFLAIRVAVETLPPFAMAAIRFVIAGTILLAVAGPSIRGATLRHWRNAFIVGALFFLGNHGLVNSAASAIPSGLACLLVATEVPMIAVLSAAFLPGHPLTRRTVLGAVAGLCGVGALVAASGLGASGVGLVPVAMVLGASALWSAGVILSRRLAFPGDPVLRSGMQMFAGALLLTGAAIARGEPVLAALTGASTRSLLALAYLIVVGSVLAFATYTWLLSRVRTDAVATHAFVNPLVAVGLGAWLGGERLEAGQLVAGAFILGSVLILTRGAGAAPREAPARRERAERGMLPATTAAVADE